MWERDQDNKPSFTLDSHHININYKKIQLTSLVVASRTILFSLGVLPVLSPDDTERAPVSAIVVGETAG